MGRPPFALTAALAILPLGALTLDPARATMPGSPAGIRAAVEETKLAEDVHVCLGWYAGYYGRCRPYAYYPSYYAYSSPYWGFHGHHWAHHGHFGGVHGSFGHFAHGGFGGHHGGGHGHH